MSISHYRNPLLIYHSLYINMNTFYISAQIASPEAPSWNCKAKIEIVKDTLGVVQVVPRNKRGRRLERFFQSFEVVPDFVSAVRELSPKGLIANLKLLNRYVNLPLYNSELYVTEISNCIPFDGASLFINSHTLKYSNRIISKFDHMTWKIINHICISIRHSGA